jgi:hypothetical protein
MEVLPLLEGLIKRPVGSDPMTPEMDSHWAKMVCERSRGSSVIGGTGSGVDAVAGVAVGVEGLVECWFFLIWSRWPCGVAVGFGGYFRTKAEVRLGQVIKWPASMASHHVERAGEKQHAW